jgi:putative MFS transporter
MTATGKPGVGARLDGLPATRYIWCLVGLVSFGAFFEIYDLSLTAPLSLGLLVAGVFHSGASGLFGFTDQATFAAVTFAGLYVGTLAFSTIADRLGRRPIFAFALLWYAVATAVMGVQDSAFAIDLWRLVASIGVGLELVAIDCYLAELMPKAVRGRAFAVSASLQFLSVPLVSVLAWQLIPGKHLGIDGWRWLAFVPAVGALLIWQVRRALPESPRWLEAHGRAVEADEVTSKIERRVARELGYQMPQMHTTTEAPKQRPAKAISLWTPPYRRRTIMLIAFHLFQTIGYFGFANWLPTLLVSRGVEIGKSLAYTAVLAFVPPIAPLAFSFVVDKVERKWMVAVGALLAAASGLLLSRITQRSDFASFTVIGAGVAIGNSLMSLSYHTYQSELFPTPVRARAVGFVYSFSRLSAIFSSYIIAATLDRAGSVGVFVLISTAMVVVALTVGLFGPSTRGLALEQI